jgi:hypothetical protein
MRSVILVVFLCPLASGQELSFGVIAGTNLTDDVKSGRYNYQGGTLPSGEISSGALVVDPGARRPIIGLKVEYRLPRNWAIEANALHRELKETTNMIFSPPAELPDGRRISVYGPYTRTLTPWEFPIMAKYRFAPPKLQPFFTVGPSFRPAGTGTGLSHVGVTAGGGVEFQARGFNISPTVRYTRWSSANSASGGPLGGPLANQVELLVGIDRPSEALAVSAFGRRLSVGVIAGVGLGRDFKPPNINSIREIPESNSRIFGVMIEAALPKNLAVEVDGLYRPLHGWANEFSHTVRFAHLTWEFPVLLKYRFSRTPRLRPFVEGGPSFRAEGNLNLRPVSHYGATLGTGLETNLAWLKISPTVRFTRWGGQEDGSVARTLANQTQLLVSFAF